MNVMTTEGAALASYASALPSVPPTTSRWRRTRKAGAALIWTDGAAAVTGHSKAVDSARID
jgi:hypothetical protein